MLPDFNRLKVFYFIFKNQSIVAAAKELNITQSAVSQHLNKLEMELKTHLFTRLHKKLIPTTAGERLYGIIKPFVNHLELGLKTFHQAREKPSGLLKIGAPVEFGKEYFPKIIAGFRQLYPDVTVFLKLGDPQTLLMNLGKGNLDFALIDVFLTPGQLYGDIGIYSIEPIIDEEVIMTCSSTYYDDLVSPKHTYEDLAGQDFISYQKNAGDLKSWFKHHFNKSPAKLRVVLTVDNLPAVISAIAHNAGMGLVASHFVYEDIQAGRIIPITTSKDEIVNRISLIQLQDKVPTVSEKVFQTFFKGEMNRSNIVKKFRKISTIE